MARKPRIHYPGAIYHVMLRGNAKQAIFHGDEEYRYFDKYSGPGAGTILVCAARVLLDEKPCSHGIVGKRQTAFKTDAKYFSALHTLV